MPETQILRVEHATDEIHESSQVFGEKSRQTVGHVAAHDLGQHRVLVHLEQIGLQITPYIEVTWIESTALGSQLVLSRLMVVGGVVQPVQPQFSHALFGLQLQLVYLQRLLHRSFLGLLHPARTQILHDTRLLPPLAEIHFQPVQVDHVLLIAQRHVLDAAVSSEVTVHLGTYRLKIKVYVVIRQLHVLQLHVAQVELQLAFPLGGVAGSLVLLQRIQDRLVVGLLTGVVYQVGT